MSRAMIGRMGTFALGFSAVMYLLCLFLPAVEIGKYGWYAGIDLASVGWFGLADGHFSWLANPLAVIALLLAVKHKRRYALYLAVLALLLACSFMIYDTMVWSESGARSAILHYGTGYYFWIASLVGLVIGILCRQTLEPQALE